MSLPHWEYFLAVESDLETCARFVEFSEDNFDAYSLEFARTMLVACSEIDTVFKMLCGSIDTDTKAKRINGYYSVVTNKYPKILEHEIEIPRFKLSLKPWEDWTEESGPEWWRAHNEVKHRRDEEFRKANLKNALHSGAALVSLLLYYYRAEFGWGVGLKQGPRLFSPKNYGLIAPVDSKYTYTLPGEPL